MTCGNCAVALPDDLTPVRGLASCPSCLRTVVVATGDMATSTETFALTDSEIEALKAQRKVARKAKAS